MKSRLFKSALAASGVLVFGVASAQQLPTARSPRVQELPSQAATTTQPAPTETTDDQTATATDLQTRPARQVRGPWQAPRPETATPSTQAALPTDRLSSADKCSDTDDSGAMGCPG
jgi:hypothetical protein